MIDKKGVTRTEIPSPETSVSPEVDANENNTNSVVEIGRSSMHIYLEHFRWNYCYGNDEDFVNDMHEAHSMRLIEAGMVPYPEKESKWPALSEGGKEPSLMYIPGVDSKAIILYPRFSALTKKEQFSLYCFYCRIYYKNKPLTETEKIAFQELRNKALLEYPAFQNFVETEWIQHQKNRVLEILPEVEQYIQGLWKMKTEKCMAIYPAYYSARSKYVNLSLHDPNNDYTVMDFQKQIRIRGGPMTMSLPSLKRPFTLVTEFNKLCKMKPVSTKIDHMTPVTHPIMPASHDMNVDFIVQQENVDVVITSSGIKTIVGSSVNPTKPWILPFTVKEVLKTDNKTVRKVVIIDKNLPLPSLSVLDKNKWHAKIASKWALALSSRPELLKEEEPLSKKERPLMQYDEDCIVEDIESFGIAATSTVSKAVNHKSSGATHHAVSIIEKLENICFNSEPTSSHEEVNKNTSKSGTELQESGQGNKEPIGSCTVSSTTDDVSILKTVKDKREMKRKMDSKFVNNISLNNGGNTFQKFSARRKDHNPCLVYKLWQLHKSRHFIMAKHEQRSLNILVRNRLDGKLIHHLADKRMLDNVCISSKLEFQPEYGVSELNKSELYREYVDLYLHQDAKLARVRTVGHTKEVMLVEVKTLADIKDSLLEKNMQLQKMFDPLYAVLTTLIDLPKGKYLLRHSANSGPFADLLTENNEQFTFTLPNYFFELREEGVNAPAAKIDPYILSAINHRNKSPPALFKPTFDVARSKFLRKPSKPSIKLHKKRSKPRKKKVNPKKELQNET